MNINEQLSIGTAAPDFTLLDQNNKPVTLKKLEGMWVVLYFYPKDETPGCIVESCSFRDNIVAIKAKNTIVLGISVDSTESHKDFAKNHQLPFKLLADPKGNVAKLYGSLRNLLLFKVAKRHSFIINPKGQITQIYRSVNPKRHVVEILADLKRIQKS